MFAFWKGLPLFRKLRPPIRLGKPRPPRGRPMQLFRRDLRLSKNITVREKYTVELMADAFNLANHTNVTGVNTLGYSVATAAVPIPGPVGTTTPCSTAAPCLNFNTSGPTPATGAPFTPQFGVANNGNSNFTYSPRQLQLGVRVKF